METRSEKFTRLEEMEDQHIISDNFVTCNSNYEIVAYLCVDAFRRCDEDDSVRRLVLQSAERAFFITITYLCLCLW